MPLSAITNLSYLQTLTLSSAGMSGTLPDFLGNAANYLSYLDISKNKFSGTLPATWSRMSGLNYLNIQNNSLTGLLDPSFKYLRPATFYTINNFFFCPLPSMDSYAPHQSGISCVTQTITSVNPSLIPSFGNISVTITGTNFFTGFNYTAYFGTNPALSTTQINANTIIAIAPGGTIGHESVALWLDSTQVTLVSPTVTYTISCASGTYLNSDQTDCLACPSGGICSGNF